MARTPGSGKPKGYKSTKTLDKEAAREFVRKAVIADLGPLIAAQLANAKGIAYLVTRNKTTGKFVRVGEAMAKVIADSDDTEKLETVEIWEKDPNVTAFADLLNRALGKPVEQVEMQVSGEVSIIETRLNAARARLAARKAEASA